MKLKKFVFDLDSKVTIYVPSTNNVNVPVDNTEQVKKVIGICERLKKEMSQEAVTLEINGQCKFV